MTPPPSAIGVTPLVTPLARTLLLLVATLTVMSGATIAPSLPAMQGHFAGVPNADVLVRLVLTIPAIAIVLVAGLAGRLADTWGRKRLLLASMVLYGIAGASGFLFDNLPLMLVSRILLGVAVAGVMTANTALIADLFENEARTRFLGAQAAFTAVGGVVFLLLGGWLAGIDWRFPFLVYLIALVLLPFVWLGVPREPQESAGTSHAKPPFPWRELMPIYLAAFGAMVFFYTIPTQLPFHLAGRFDASPFVSGAAIALSSGFGAVGSFFFARVTACLSPSHVAAISFGLVGLGLVLIGVAPTVALVGLGLVVLGFGNGLAIPNLNLWLTNLVPATLRGTALGLLTASIFLGQFSSPLLSQPLAKAFSLGSTYIILGVLAVLLGSVMLLAQRKRTMMLLA